MNFWMIGCSLAAAQLLGACAADAGSAPTDDHASGLPTGDEAVEISGRHDSLWMEGCDQAKSDMLYAANVYAHFALQQAMNAYSPAGARENQYFGVGHDSQAVEFTLLDMWYINLTYKPTTYVCGGTTGSCARGFPAHVTPGDVEGGIERIYFCDSAFDQNFICDDPARCHASLTGVLLHEMAHLAGAVSPDPVTWPAIQAELAQWPESWRGSISPNIADIYHHYILNLPTY